MRLVPTLPRTLPLALALVAACADAPRSTRTAPDAPLADASADAGAVAEQRQTQGVRRALTVGGIREHLAAIAQIAAANGGSRVAGSAGEAATAEYVRARTTAVEPAAIGSGRSRAAAAFASVGVPVGGLDAGTGGIKTAAGAALYGGTARVAYDPCFAFACDTFANVNDVPLDQLSDAAGHAVLLLSRRNLARDPLVPAAP